jgi:hypothetical protein
MRVLQKLIVSGLRPLDLLLCMLLIIDPNNIRTRVYAIRDELNNFLD